MTTKKTNTTSAKPQWESKTTKTDGDCGNDCQKHFYYDYYTYNNNYSTEHQWCKPLFTLTERGKKFFDAVFGITIGLVGGILIFSIISSWSKIRKIENLLDSKDVPVHTVPSTTNTQTK